MGNKRFFDLDTESEWGFVKGVPNRPVCKTCNAYKHNDFPTPEECECGETEWNEHLLADVPVFEFGQEDRILKRVLQAEEEKDAISSPRSKSESDTDMSLTGTGNDITPFETPKVPPMPIRRSRHMESRRAFIQRMHGRTNFELMQTHVRQLYLAQQPKTHRRVLEALLDEITH